MGSIGDNHEHCFPNSKAVALHVAVGAGIPMSDHVAIVGETMVSTVGDLSVAAGMRLNWY